MSSWGWVLVAVLVTVAVMAALVLALERWAEDDGPDEPGG